MIKLIPMPNNLIIKEGDCFLYKKRVILKVAQELQTIRPLVKEYLPIETRESEDAAHIEYIYDSDLGEETYSLIAEACCVKVFAGTYSGAFYGLMTLRQLFLTDEIDEETFICPQLEIREDSPENKWRGLHLDESRHFFGKDTVKKYLDYMALYKLNRFHWHLTDDQGWRIEIEKYPRLTEVGSYRKGSQLHAWDCKEMDHTPHFGYYTKEDIKEIIAYAKERCIEIIPEIDFPAHSAAAIAAYNELACRNIECEVFDFFGAVIPQGRGNKNWNRTLCLGKNDVIDFVKDVIGEVADLFPFEYFHVGGDEAPTNEWKKCPECQKRIKAEKLKDEVDLQRWFTNEINAFLKSKGKIMVGWNEVLASNKTEPDVVAQYWTPKDDKNVIRHLKKGGKVILSNHKNFYFDMYYAYCTVEDTYKFKPEKLKIKNELKDNILGVEAELWTEWIVNEKQLFFMLFNRGLALSENAWSKNKNFKSFKNRLEAHKAIMDKMGIYYGENILTMKKSKKFRKKMAKKNGFTHKHYDSDFRISEIYDSKLKREAEEKRRREKLEEEYERNALDLDGLIDKAIAKAKDIIFEKEEVTE